MKELTLIAIIAILIALYVGQLVMLLILVLNENPKKGSLIVGSDYYKVRIKHFIPFIGMILKLK